MEIALPSPLNWVIHCEYLAFAGFMLVAIQFLRFGKHTNRVAVLELNQIRIDEIAAKLLPGNLFVSAEQKGKK